MPDHDDARAREIARYLETGDSDPLFNAWPGNSLERCRAGDDALRDALVSEVQARASDVAVMASAPADVDAIVRRKLTRIVAGLFPVSERVIVADALCSGVRILTRHTIDTALRTCPWPDAAWMLANIYLTDVGAEPLGDGAHSVVGLRVGTLSCVSVSYFRDEDPFADFVVHEAAHAFHNCKRETIGLSHRQRQPWLLDIAYDKRETFAYACEAYSCMLDVASTPGRRREAVATLAMQPPPADERVDPGEFVDIMKGACEARNGWKHILERCAPANL